MGFLSNNILLSIATPFFVLSTSAYVFGVTYPVNIIAPHTWGILGLSFTLLTVAVIGNKQYKFGAFLLGLAPAVQAVYGLCLWLVVGVSLLLDWKVLRSHLKKAIKYFILGCLIFVISLLYHVITSPGIPDISKDIASEYLRHFVRIWEIHRNPADFTSVGMYLNITGLVISVFWLTFFKKELTENTRFVLLLKKGP